MDRASLTFRSFTAVSSIPWLPYNMVTIAGTLTSIMNWVNSGRFTKSEVTPEDVFCSNLHDVVALHTLSPTTIDTRIAWDFLLSAKLKLFTTIKMTAKRVYIYLVANCCFSSTEKNHDYQRNIRLQSMSSYYRT